MPTLFFKESSISLQGERRHNPFPASLRVPAQEGLCPGPCCPVTCFHSLQKGTQQGQGFGTIQLLSDYKYIIYMQATNKLSKILHSLLNPLELGLFLQLFSVSPKSSPSCKHQSVSSYSRNATE